jgi:hypothetical protein
VPLGRKVFLAVVLSQLFSIALILGWYFYTLRSELGSLTQQRAQEAVLQSIAATEDYFQPAEAVVEAGQLLLSDHILGMDKPDPLETLFFLTASRFGRHISARRSRNGPETNQRSLAA